MRYLYFSVLKIKSCRNDWRWCSIICPSNTGNESKRWSLSWPFRLALSWNSHHSMLQKKKKKRTCNSEIDHQTPNGSNLWDGDSFPFALIFNTIIIDRLAGVGHATLRLYNEFYINQFKAHDFQHMFRRVPRHKNSSLIGQII